MWRFLAGVGSALLLVAAGVLIWRSQADAVQTVAAAPADEAALGFADVNAPPQASEKTREQKRFGRYDKDKNGAVSRGEYLLSRQKAYAKLDTNGDGRLSFEEFAIKTTQKFAKADRDGTGVLTPAEFLTTRVVRKTHKAKCPPPSRLQQAAPAEDEGDAEA
jgi:hypothetical protein